MDKTAEQDVGELVMELVSRGMFERSVWGCVEKGEMCVREREEGGQKKVADWLPGGGLMGTYIHHPTVFFFTRRNCSDRSVPDHH